MALLVIALGFRKSRLVVIGLGTEMNSQVIGKRAFFLPFQNIKRFIGLFGTTLRSTLLLKN
ncbi:Hypothetical protein Minf_1919 [Methylacidiphilum infernorum V4]|uniref:Uncharacterized protein n=1 Tax=Methylacidiphilum infernorum (isolate V4) TaxID=481448 RepID=B3DY21_METI4|nr:Hypothetical protein Minf_1919 [Methylacidiphilum infernorum V4]